MKHTTKLFLSVLFILTAGGFSNANTKVNGFVDAQFRWAENDNANSGYRINDAALILTHTKGKASLTIDLPFGMSSNTNNNFNVAQDKAQAFITINHSGSQFTMGQFDTIYGFEANDSKDVFFNSAGVLANGVLRTTHTGIMASRDWSSMISTKLLVANSKNRGANGPGQSPEYGLQVGLNFGAMYANLGYLTFARDNDTEHKFAELMAGGKFGDWKVDFEYDMIEDTANKNNADLDKGSNLLLNIRHDCHEKFNTAFRYVMTDKMANAYSQTNMTLGINYFIEDTTTLKFDIGQSETEATKGATKAKATYGAVALVYGF